MPIGIYERTYKIRKNNSKSKLKYWKTHIHPRKGKNDIEYFGSEKAEEIRKKNRKSHIGFDGLYFHTDIKKDIERDTALNEVGYKVLHYRGYIPSKKELRKDIYFFINNIVFSIYKEGGKEININKMLNQKCVEIEVKK